MAKKAGTSFLDVAEGVVYFLGCVGASGEISESGLRLLDPLPPDERRRCTRDDGPATDSSPCFPDMEYRDEDVIADME